MKCTGPALLAYHIDDADGMRIDEYALTLLEETSHIEGIVVVAVSDADAGDLALRLRGSGAYVIGDGGLEVRGPHGEVMREASPRATELDGDLRREIGASGVRLDARKHSFRVEWQGVPYAAIAPVLDAFRSWGREYGYEVVERSCAVEARSPRCGKQEALQWLARAIGATRLIDAAISEHAVPPLSPFPVAKEVMM
jgi:hypothetical protein